MTRIVLGALTLARRARVACSRVATIALVALLVASCGARSKEDIVSRARDVTTRAELERVVGKPDDITKVGPVETWTYRASNGRVVFVIVGDKVTLQAAGADDGTR